tara:strand:- start:62 stop:343 length:282 start_codon:yes stop_codon:yes gene_type:complete
MALDHFAIRKAYPEVVTTDDSGLILDKDNNPVSVDQSLIDSARAELNKLAYQDQRKEEYPDWGTQLDYIYHNGIDKWKTDIVDPVKAKYPKPS